MIIAVVAVMFGMTTCEEDKGPTITYIPGKTVVFSIDKSSNGNIAVFTVTVQRAKFNSNMSHFLTDTPNVITAERLFNLFDASKSTNSFNVFTSSYTLSLSNDSTVLTFTRSQNGTQFRGDLYLNTDPEKLSKCVDVQVLEETGTPNTHIRNTFVIDPQKASLQF